MIWRKLRDVNAGTVHCRYASRDRVLDLLRDPGSPVGVRELCEQTGLSAHAIRFRPRALQRAGGVLSAKSGVRKRSGRPPVLYQALRPAGVDPAATYRILTGLLAAEHSRSSPVGSPARAGREWARGMVSDVHSGVDPADLTAVGLSALREAGFEPAADVGSQTVALYRCPFGELAAEHPDVVCGMHLGLLTGLLEQIGASTAVRLVPVMDGSGPCLVWLGACHPERCLPPISSHSKKEQGS